MLVYHLAHGISFRHNMSSTSAIDERESFDKSEEKIHERCEVCCEQDFKYRCPGCNMKTCSLKCVKEHKEIKNCIGKRCMTNYVSVKDFTDTNLLSDYRFLENISRCCSNATRYEKNKPNLPKWANRNRNRLTNVAWKKGIQLHLLSQGMSKQKENTTIFNARDKFIHWRVKLVFVNEDEEYILPRVKETEKLRDILKKYIDPEYADQTMKYRLRSYFEATIDNICVYLKKEQASDLEYYKMNLSETLSDCLHDKVIFEYPVFHVLISGKDSAFEVIQETFKGQTEISTYTNNGDSREEQNNTRNNYGATDIQKLNMDS